MLLICFTGTEGKTEIDDDRNEKKKVDVTESCVRQKKTREKYDTTKAFSLCLS